MKATGTRTGQKLPVAGWLDIYMLMTKPLGNSDRPFADTWKSD